MRLHPNLAIACLLLAVLGCKQEPPEFSLEAFRQKTEDADYILLCDVVVSGRIGKYVLNCPLYSSGAVKVPYTEGETLEPWVIEFEELESHPDQTVIVFKKIDGHIGPEIFYNVFDGHVPGADCDLSELLALFPDAPKPRVRITKSEEAPVHKGGLKPLPPSKPFDPETANFQIAKAENGAPPEAIRLSKDSQLAVKVEGPGYLLVSLVESVLRRKASTIEELATLEWTLIYDDQVENGTENLSITYKSKPAAQGGFDLTQIAGSDRVTLGAKQFGWSYSSENAVYIYPPPLVEYTVTGKGAQDRR